MDRGGVGASGRAVSRRHAQESGLGRAQGRSFTESRTCAAAAAFPSSLRSLPLLCGRHAAQVHVGGGGDPCESSYEMLNTFG